MNFPLDIGSIVGFSGRKKDSEVCKERGMGPVITWGCCNLTACVKIINCNFS